MFILLIGLLHAAYRHEASISITPVALPSILSSQEPAYDGYRILCAILVEHLGAIRVSAHHIAISVSARRCHFWTLKWFNLYVRSDLWELYDNFEACTVIYGCVVRFFVVFGFR